MKGTLFDNMDIELYVDGIELTAVALPKLELEGKKLKQIYEPFECALKRPDGSDSGRNARLEGTDLKGMGDGIEVSYQNPTYFVKANFRATDLVDLRGRFGSRYGHGEKIDIIVLR